MSRARIASADIRAHSANIFADGAGHPGYAVGEGSARPREGWILVPGKGALFAPRTLPFTFPSIDHLDLVVDRMAERMVAVEGMQPATAAWVRVAYKVFRRFVLSSANTRQLLSGDLQLQLNVLEDWVADLRKNGRSRVTINNYWRALRLVFARVCRSGGLLSPLDFAATPKFVARAPRYLTREMAERVLLYAQNRQWQSAFESARNVCLIGMLLLAGMRRAEVLKLNISDVDVGAGRIRIAQGKGRHGGKDRTAYMPPQLRAFARTYLAARAKREPTTPAFFVSARGDARMHPPGVRHIFEKISAALGTSVSPHMLRHTYATLLRQAGIADRLAMDLLGHSSLDMLQRYSHVMDGEAAAAAEKLTLDVDAPPPGEA